MSKNTLFPIGILCLFALLIGCSTSKTIEKADFTKEVTLKLEPGEDNPRNSEGDFVTLKSGRILFVYSHYTGKSSSDHASAYLASRYSDDNGKKWSTKSELVVQKEGVMNVMSVSLLRLKNGDLALFYLKKNAIDDCIPLVRFSKDEGKTWSEPTACITDKKGYFVLNNNRVIQLKSGRLMFAVALHQTPETKWNGTGRLFSYYSDDNGKTWQAGGEVANPNNIVTQEPGLIELKNGQIMMFIRAGTGVQYQSFSKDKGLTWSAAEPTTLKSPLSPASIARIPSTGDLFLIWNNNDGSNPATKGKRTPLSIAISKDDGKTWEKVKNIEDDPQGWYCYMAIHFTKNSVLLGYCSNAPPRKGHLTQTNITRLSLDWIYN